MSLRTAQQTAGNFRSPRRRAREADWASTAPPSSMLGIVGKELRAHAPFTLLGTLTGIAIMVFFAVTEVPRSFSVGLFWGLHPLHVLLSALVTAGMYRLHSHGKLWATLFIGYFGSVGIATLSDCIIPYLGETLLGLPNKGIYFGFIEKWWLLNPLAVIGIAVAYLSPKTGFPHAGHVLLSTWASLFHMTMALGKDVGPLTLAIIPVFLFLAVWIPCCTSDIVFPLLFSHDAVPGRQSTPREDGAFASSGRLGRSREPQAEDVQTKDSRL
jgi:hypothetical protein